MLGRQPRESFCEILVFVLILRSSLLLTQSGHLSAHVELSLGRQLGRVNRCYNVTSSQPSRPSPFNASSHLAHSVLGLWTKRLYSHFCIYFSLERHAPNLSVTAAVGILKHTCARPRAASVAVPPLDDFTNKMIPEFGRQIRHRHSH